IILSRFRNSARENSTILTILFKQKREIRPPLSRRELKLRNQRKNGGGGGGPIGVVGLRFNLDELTQFVDLIEGDFEVSPLPGQVPGLAAFSHLAHRTKTEETQHLGRLFAGVIP